MIDANSIADDIADVVRKEMALAFISRLQCRAKVLSEDLCQGRFPEEPQSVDESWRQAVRKVARRLCLEMVCSDSLDAKAQSTAETLLTQLLQVVDGAAGEALARVLETMAGLPQVPVLSRREPLL